MIRKIRIRNFRSIVDQTISMEEISIFVGNNDAGKSNVLRALNLFFNGETDHKQSLDFDSDFSTNAKVAEKQAKEITIELILKLPKSYRKSHDEVYWRKVWRAEGEWEQSEKMLYAAPAKNNILRGGDEFEPRVKIRSLLANIKYFYVPAIKDKSFFLEIQGKMYDALSGIYGTKLHSSANDFESAINSEFQALIDGLNSTFSTKNGITLPRNLRSVFENLEIQSEGVPLFRRGDGIKVRHIPAMLRCIKSGDLGRERKVICPHIWGFEEPENNVEYSACYKLRDEFIEAANEKIQVVLTTHSPVIYTLPKDIKSGSQLKVSRQYVEKTENGTALLSIEENQIHQNIGFMPLISPILEEENTKWKVKFKAIEAEKTSLQVELQKNDLPRIYVEGESDKVILDRAIELYRQNLKDKLVIFIGQTNSANAAADRAKAHYLINKHRNEKAVKCILLLDGDEAGKEAGKGVSEFISDRNKNIVKIIYVEPSATHGLLGKGFAVDKCLEAFYPEMIWSLAKSRNWLAVKPLSKIFTACKRDSMLDEGINQSSEIAKIQGVGKYLVKYRFSDEGKRKASSYIAGLPDPELLENEYLKEIDSVILSKVQAFFDQ